MAHNFGRTIFTPAIRALQEEHGSRRQYARWDTVAPGEDPADRLGPDERRFLGTRDSFYIASVSANGWPYVQHRGGPAGFIQVLDPETIAFADYRGNKQYITSGNLATDDRVALILMDYPSQTRLKILGHAELIGPSGDGAVPNRASGDRPASAKHHSYSDLAKLYSGPTQPNAQYFYLVHVIAFDWNCQQYITPRYTEEQVERAVAPLQQRVQELEAENAKLKALTAKQVS